MKKFRLFLKILGAVAVAVVPGGLLTAAIITAVIAYRRRKRFNLMRSTNGN